MYCNWVFNHLSFLLILSETLTKLYDTLTQVDDARIGLQASLLVRSPETGELFVNFDPEILSQIREANCMTRMNLEIPPFASLLQQKQDTLKKNFNKLQVDITHSCLYEKKIVPRVPVVSTWQISSTLL